MFNYRTFPQTKPTIKIKTNNLAAVILNYFLRSVTSKEILKTVTYKIETDYFYFY